MKAYILPILSILISLTLLGCQGNKVSMPNAHKPRMPTGQCEIVGPMYEFEYKKGYDIILLQPIVRKNRIVLLLGDTHGDLQAFLMRSVKPSKKEDQDDFIDKITLSTAGKVLKLEGYGSGDGSVHFGSESYNSYVSYNRRDWQSLVQAKMNQKDLARDIALMESAWKDAMRLDYVRNCYNSDSKEVKNLAAISSATNIHCYIDDEECQAFWEDWGDWNGSSADEYTEPPFHYDWYPDDIRDDLGGVAAKWSCNRWRATRPKCEEVQWSTFGSAVRGNPDQARKAAKRIAREGCGYASTVVKWGNPKICTKGDRHKYAIRGCCDIKIIDRPPEEE